MNTWDLNKKIQQIVVSIKKKNDDTWDLNKKFGCRKTVQQILGSRTKSRTKTSTFKAFVYFFFLCITICCTFCSNSKFWSYLVLVLLFSKSNYLLYILFKFQVIITPFFLKANFYFNEPFGFLYILDINLEFVVWW